MSSERICTFSDSFVISCGTVAFDTNRRRVLTILYRPKNELMLPKGRKDIGETLEAAAIRETLEETGYTCQLLQHKAPTLATSPEPPQSTTEPFAVQQRMIGPIRKIIFWYLATVDSSSTEKHDIYGTGEDFNVHWLQWSEAAEHMAFTEDRELIVKAADIALASSGCDCHGIPSCPSNLDD